MKNSIQLNDKIRPKIQAWFDTNGMEFVICIKEFCQGNRASLRPLMALLKNLGTDVFAVDGRGLNGELLDDLEYGIFDLIGRFTSTPGGPALLKAIQENVVDYLTEILAYAKRRWNLNNYKITESIEALDPNSCIIPESSDDLCDIPRHKSEPERIAAQRQARAAIDDLVLFAKVKFRGDKSRKIAINWLENPEKNGDINWLATLVGTTTGSTKVTLTRIKKAIAQKYELKRSGNGYILNPMSCPAHKNAFLT